MNCSAPEAAIRVLIIEDNPVDLYFIREALKAAELNCEPIAVDDGDPALRFLRQDSPYQQERPPDLVVLDLNLKRVDGREVLSYIRSTPALRAIPVAIVSSSPADIVGGENLGADCYIRKPSDMEAFLGIGKAIWQCYLEKQHRC